MLAKYLRTCRISCKSFANVTNAYKCHCECFMNETTIYKPIANFSLLLIRQPPPSQPLLHQVLSWLESQVFILQHDQGWKKVRWRQRQI